MGYTYDIATSQKDKKSTIGLSVCHIVHKIIEVFVSTFLIAHIYSLTTNLYSYAINVAIYQMSAYACMFVVYLLLSYIQLHQFY